jgi:peptidoglycan hydrolase-like protein with peptidoglycan-binding domain
VLRKGSTGQEVEDLQEMLNLVIPLPPLLAVDGIFGPKTLERVMTFQRQAALAADGIVGPLTSKALIQRVFAVIGAG